LFVFLASLICSVLSSTMYGVVTTTSDTETIVQVAEVNLQTGNLSNFIEVFTYYQASIMADGISGFDATNSIYYYASDDETPLLYSVDIAKQESRPPLLLYVEVIISITVNPVTSEAFVAIANTNAPTLLIYGVTLKNEVRVVFEPPSRYEAIYTGAFSDDGKYLYLAAYIVNTTQSGAAIVTLDPQSGNILKEIFVDCDVFPTKLEYDPSGTLFSGGEMVNDSTVYYYYSKVNPTTGACSYRPVSTSQGIITSWAYDPQSKIIWYAEEINGGFLLRGVDVTNGKEVAAFNTLYLLESIEIDTSS